ncbi:hypothetical protein [Sorangium sp. So ce1024]|uniref:hypothetical protein n=1 Tax=unclassified Sorangium TaxID=2621164 RepID=UPI003F0D51EA
MNESGPDFYAWCDEADRLDAFAEALSALAYPGGVCSVSLSTLGTSERLWRDGVLVEEVIEMVRAAFKPGSQVDVDFHARWRWLSRTGLNLECYGEERARWYPYSPLRVGTGERKDVFPDCLEIAVGLRSVEVEAAIASMDLQQEMKEILLGLCAPGAHAHVTTGMCTAAWAQPAPIEACATYHADARVARDLALSWVHLHDGDIVGRASGLSLDALAARVEAAPRGACVGVASDVERVDQHLSLDRAASRSRDERPTHVGAVRRGPRARLPDDAELTREQVLAALATPPATLIEALDASAVSDDEWRAVEPRVLELIDAVKQGAPTSAVNVRTGRHIRFIERHSPYHVQVLPNGGVMLAIHPYRTLWPLWADALLLLGIRP